MRNKVAKPLAQNARITGQKKKAVKKVWVQLPRPYRESAMKVMKQLIEVHKKNRK